MSTDHAGKNGTAESNDNVISGLPRPMVAETTSGQICDKNKILKNSQTVADRRALRGN
jgi:hypothetical protein